MSHSAEKCKRGPFLIYIHAFCCKITKNSKGDPLGTLKNFRTVPKKIKRGDPLVSAAGFVGYLEEVKNEKGDPLETKQNFGKSRTVPKKNRKGDSSISSGFVGYLEEVKNERGDPLH